MSSSVAAYSQTFASNLTSAISSIRSDLSKGKIQKIALPSIAAAVSTGLAAWHVSSSKVSLAAAGTQVTLAGLLSFAAVYAADFLVRSFLLNNPGGSVASSEVPFQAVAAGFNAAAGQIKATIAGLISSTAAIVNCGKTV